MNTSTNSSRNAIHLHERFPASMKASRTTSMNTSRLTPELERSEAPVHASVLSSRSYVFDGLGCQRFSPRGAARQPIRLLVR